LLKKNLRIHGMWRDSYLYALLKEEWEATHGICRKGAGSAQPTPRSE
jgi:hypothetical protein